MYYNNSALYEQKKCLIFQLHPKFYNGEGKWSHMRYFVFIKQHSYYVKQKNFVWYSKFIIVLNLLFQLTIFCFAQWNSLFDLTGFLCLLQEEIIFHEEEICSIRLTGRISLCELQRRTSVIADWVFLWNL